MFLFSIYSQKKRPNRPVASSSFLQGSNIVVQTRNTEAAARQRTPAVTTTSSVPAAQSVPDIIKVTIGQSGLTPRVQLLLLLGLRQVWIG